MQRKRNEDGGLAGGGLTILQQNRTVHSENRPAHNEDRPVHNENRRVRSKSITTFDVYRQNRDFHRML